MPDFLDAVQEHVEAQTQASLQAHLQRKTAQGRTTCANLDCGEGIHPMRTDMGAQLCIDCQREEEATAKLRGRW